MTIKTRYLIAILVAIAAAFLGTISIVRVDLGGKLVEAVKTAIPKLRVVRAGGCDYIYDRDDGKLVATKCASDPSAYQETIDKLRGQLEAANSQIQKFKQEVETAKARVAELERESIARADAASKALSEREATIAELRREIERFKKGPPDTVELMVDYDLSVSEYIDKGKYDGVGIREVTDWTGVEKLGKQTVWVRLFLADQGENGTLKQMEAAGCRPANVIELLAFGAQYPEKQRDAGIVALGSKVVRLISRPAPRNAYPLLGTNQAGDRLTGWTTNVYDVYANPRSMLAICTVK